MKTKFDEQVILDKAMLLFWKYGFQHCSMAILKKELGLSASSIYHAWGNKDGLFQKSVEQYGKKVTNLLIRKLKKEEDGYKSIVDLFRFVIEFHTTQNDWGCLNTNTIAEMRGNNSKLASFSLGLSIHLEEAFLEVIKRGQKQKTINPKHDPEILASFLMTVLFGLQVRVKANEKIRSTVGRIMPQIELSLK
ncbi:MAG: TetR/AcrR family transcriptional regulator [Aureispira sp.]|nr:TetR/AcrR family transcriptional regulator [Aureispira sp.]